MFQSFDLRLVRWEHFVGEYFCTAEASGIFLLLQPDCPMVK